MRDGVKGERLVAILVAQLAKNKAARGWNIFFIAPHFPLQVTHAPLPATAAYVKTFDNVVEHYLSPFTPSLTLSLTVQRAAFQCFTLDVREVKDIDAKKLQLVIHTSVPKKEV